MALHAITASMEHCSEDGTFWDAVALPAGPPCGGVEQAISALAMVAARANFPPVIFKASIKNQITTKDPARRSRNQISEYLPQRRKGREGRRLRVKVFHKRSYLSLLSLATLRLGGRNFRLRVRSACRSFVQATQISN
jgi:hypothetical protein